MRANDEKEGDRMEHKDDVLTDASVVSALSLRRKDEKNGDKRSKSY